MLDPRRAVSLAEVARRGRTRPLHMDYALAGAPGPVAAQSGTPRRAPGARKLGSTTRYLARTLAFASFVSSVECRPTRSGRRRQQY